MKDRKRAKVEYRYFEMSVDAYVIGLLNMGELRRHYNEEDRVHLHNYMELGYCYGGDGKIVMGNQTLRFGKGTLCIVPPGQPHVTIGEDGKYSWEYLVVDVAGFLSHLFAPDRLEFAGRTADLIHQRAWVLEPKEYGQLGEMAAELLWELGTKGEYYEESVRGRLLTLLMEIARFNLRKRGNGVVWEHRYREMLSPALRYIREHYSRDIRISDLARECCASETHFRRCFGEVMNMPPARYINLVRISMACELLRGTGFAIREIGAMTGYPTLSTFQRNFKSLTGIQPGLWRKHSEKWNSQGMELLGPLEPETRSQGLGSGLIL